MGARPADFAYVLLLRKQRFGTSSSRRLQKSVTPTPAGLPHASVATEAVFAPMAVMKITVPTSSRTVAFSNNVMVDLLISFSCIIANLVLFVKLTK